MLLPLLQNNLLQAVRTGTGAGTVLGLLGVGTGTVTSTAAVVVQPGGAFGRPFIVRRHPRQVAVYAEVTASQALVLGIGVVQEPMPVATAVFALSEVSAATVHGTGVGYDEGVDVPMLMEVA